MIRHLVRLVRDRGQQESATPVSIRPVSGPRRRRRTARTDVCLQGLESRRLFAASALTASAPVLTEDFSSGAAADFTPVDGRWAVVDGGYRITTAVNRDTPHLNNRAVHATSVDGDFTVEAD